VIPPGYEGLSGRAYLGYSHGAAGIACALLDLYEATGDERYRASALGAGRWVASQAQPTPADPDGLDWPSTADGGMFGPYWCHGAAGIGRFFLHAADLGIMPEAADLAARAARAAASGARRANPTQCHGLAGNIEFLLDMYQANGDRAYRAEAWSLAQLLLAFAHDQAGRLVFSSESPVVFTPDYMVGYAGVAVCLLRLAEPHVRPHQLSRRGFRYSASCALRASAVGEQATAVVRRCHDTAVSGRATT
jgi:lantibiotic modifying enzyme